MKLSVPEKAMEKNSAVSMLEPIRVLTRGACHHALVRREAKTETSISWAIRKARPEPTAMRRVTSGPNSPMICVPISEQIRPATKPTSTTRRAAEVP